MNYSNQTLSSQAIGGGDQFKASTQYGATPASLPLMEQIEVAFGSLDGLGQAIDMLEGRLAPVLSMQQDNLACGGQPCTPSSDPAAIEGMRSILNRIAAYSAMVNEIAMRVRV